MLDRNLQVLEHPNPDSVNVQDIQQFRKLVHWLNDTHIRSSSSATSGLSDSYSAGWDNSYKEFLTEQGFPFDWFPDSQNQHQESLAWLIGLAVKKQYSHRAKDLNVKSSAKMIGAVVLGDNPAKRQKVTSSDPIESMDFQSDDFKEGVKRLAVLLEVPHIHPDHLVTLEACCKIIQSRLNAKCLQNPGKVVPGAKGGETFDLKDHAFGVSDDVITDPVLREAMKILRLTHLNHLRDLQSEINAAIETVQAATANPKTDTRLGKVGR